VRFSLVSGPGEQFWPNHPGNWLQCDEYADKAGGSSTLDANGIAVLSTDTLTAGSHTVTFVDEGDPRVVAGRRQTLGVAPLDPSRPQPVQGQHLTAQTQIVS
jgi:hypothetical protein